MENKVVMEKGGTYLNLLDAHPPFQINGNFCATADGATIIQGPNGAATNQQGSISVAP
ncbi:MAG: hypothetical protein ABI600_04015 [Luteolibacter sp.]